MTILKNFLTLTFLITVSSTFAQTPTFHLDIAPIIYNNCTSCHRVGELGPMPLTTYDEVATNGFFIEYVTQSGYMPPWTPDHNYVSLNGERFLSEQEKQTIVDWVAAYMPEGDPLDNPGMPDFPTGSQIGTPDLVLSMSEPYLHGGDGLEQYQVFRIPTGITESVEVSAVEIRPSNGAIAHHGLIGYTNNASSIASAASMDDSDPAYGYESFGDYGVPVEDQIFGGWVPGSPPLIFPPTIGKIMEPGSELLLQMHYGPVYQDELDQTSINIFFSPEPIEREIETYIMTPVNLSQTFYIPANEIVSFHGTISISDDVSVISIIPHSHLLGKSWL
ncbi:MAG: c-type cytochrome, partial [Flavobacteriales bacterium]